ncbi:uncharacterized protein si:ch211-12e13.1 isoform X1 [Scophthalmus maximus]|uniref:uncharacterized protein si:ch211-12e13.1 isoform X1 n=1 Tax=Scophthalmus maximus TaxID=52904 RepID=UPI001FA8AB9C|nr:uncharacterized protein si:ch211-12e13.1 isoform X1 [Scophthalmus maximus]
MGNAQSYGVASLTVCSVYFVYVYIYRSHKLLQVSVLHCDKLPSFAYLYIKYLTRVLTRRTGCLHKTPTPQKKSEVAFTVRECRLETVMLRRFCSRGGYGWDYPETEYRDLPLCFPEFLCGRLLLMLLTDDNFRLSPAGLVPVCQSLKTHQPIDELKKGPFMLQVQVLLYRQIDAGVEVDICLSANSCSGSPVWESVLKLLSKNKLHKANSRLKKTENDSEQFSEIRLTQTPQHTWVPPQTLVLVLTGQSHEPVPDNMKQVELRVPWSTDLLCSWSCSDYSLYQLLSLPARLFGCRSQTVPSLWMLSVCLAEIEKHKGVEVITAPINVTAQFKEPLSVPGKVTIRFWETNRDQSSAQSLSFHMQQHGSNISHMVGMISRS